MLSKKNILYTTKYMLYSKDSNHIFKFVSENFEYKFLDLNIIKINNNKYLFDLKQNYIYELKNNRIYNINNYTFVINSPVDLVDKLQIIHIGFFFTK
jgi:hypothetical protein